MTTQKEWFERVQGNRSMRSIAAGIGVGSGNLSTWLKNNKLSAERIIAISYEVGTDPIQSLIDTGFIQPTKEDHEVTTEELAQRISRLTKMLEERAKNNIANLDSRRNVHPVSQNDHMPEGAVAYDGPDEDQLREERNEFD